tara:strand:- start:477 stop:983 length:507 start_codon:yes stop_codon:yes gene_type:complete
LEEEGEEEEKEKDNFNLGAPVEEVAAFLFAITSFEEEREGSLRMILGFFSPSTSAPSSIFLLFSSDLPRADDVEEEEDSDLFNELAEESEVADAVVVVPPLLLALCDVNVTPSILLVLLAAPNLSFSARSFATLCACPAAFLMLSECRKFDICVELNRNLILFMFGPD